MYRHQSQPIYASHDDSGYTYSDPNLGRVPLYYYYAPHSYRRNYAPQTALSQYYDPHEKTLHSSYRRHRRSKKKKKKRKRQHLSQEKPPKREPRAVIELETISSRKREAKRDFGGFTMERIEIEEAGALEKRNEPKVWTPRGFMSEEDIDASSNDSHEELQHVQHERRKYVKVHCIATNEQFDIVINYATYGADLYSLLEQQSFPSPQLDWILITESGQIIPTWTILNDIEEFHAGMKLFRIPAVWAPLNVHSVSDLYIPVKFRLLNIIGRIVLSWCVLSFLVVLISDYIVNITTFTTFAMSNSEAYASEGILFICAAITISFTTMLYSYLFSMTVQLLRYCVLERFVLPEIILFCSNSTGYWFLHSSNFIRSTISLFTLFLGLIYSAIGDETGIYPFGTCTLFAGSIFTIAYWLFVSLSDIYCFYISVSYSVEMDSMGRWGYPEKESIRMKRDESFRGNEQWWEERYRKRSEIEDHVYDLCKEIHSWRMHPKRLLYYIWLVSPVFLTCLMWFCEFGANAMVWGFFLPILTYLFFFLRSWRVWFLKSSEVIDRRQREWPSKTIFYLLLFFFLGWQIIRFDQHLKSNTIRAFGTRSAASTLSTCKIKSFNLPDAAFWARVAQNSTLRKMKESFSFYYHDEFCSDGVDCGSSSWRIARSSFETPNLIYLRKPDENLHVIAIGISPKDDYNKRKIIHWIPSAVLRLIGFGFPVYGIWSDNTARVIVHNLARWHRYLNADAEEEFWIKQANWVDSLSFNADDSILIVGHSISGSLAQILASRLVSNGYRNAIGVGLASPGLTFTSELFKDYGRDPTSSFSVIAENDVISRFERHSVAQTSLNCNLDSGKECRSSYAVLCELIHRCPSKTQVDHISRLQSSCEIGSNYF